MPNWCSNTLEVQGAEEERNKLFTEVGRLIDKELETGSGQKPEGLDITIDPYSGNHVWMFSIYADGEMIQYESKWGPLYEMLKYWSSKYPTLVFSNEYEEPGMFIFGKAFFKNGELIHNIELEDEHQCEYIHEGEHEDMYKTPDGKIIKSDYEYYSDIIAAKEKKISIHV